MKAKSLLLAALFAALTAIGGFIKISIPYFLSRTWRDSSYGDNRILRTAEGHSYSRIDFLIDFWI